MCKLVDVYSIIASLFLKYTLYLHFLLIEQGFNCDSLSRYTFQQFLLHATVNKFNPFISTQKYLFQTLVVWV